MLTIAGRAALLAAMCIAAAAAAVGAAHAQTAEQRSYDFTVTWSVAPELPLSTGRIRVEEDNAFYTIALDARANLTVPRVDWRGVFATQGDVADGERAPQRFERSSIRPDLREDVIVSWGGAETPQTTTRRVPSNAVVRREQVDPSTIVDVVDPLTFAVSMLDVVSQTNGASCEMTRRTWDGARLSVLQVVTGEGVAGSRVDCKVIYRSIAGLREDNPWRSREEQIDRRVRFEKRLGRWEPVFVEISGVFVGLQSTFRTDLAPSPAG